MGESVFSQCPCIIVGVIGDDVDVDVGVGVVGDTSGGGQAQLPTHPALVSGVPMHKVAGGTSLAQRLTCLAHCNAQRLSWLPQHLLSINVAPPCQPHHFSSKPLEGRKVLQMAIISTVQ